MVFCTLVLLFPVPTKPAVKLCYIGCYLRYYITLVLALRTWPTAILPSYC